ncbi:MAG: phosphoribosylanthranilate isomerase [Pseudomonadota bacterium]
MTGRGYIKICGLTRPHAIRAALDAGADAVGFVFAPSPREVSPEQALPLVDIARGRADIVAVMLHPAAWLVDMVLGLVQPDILQTDAEDYASIELPPGVQALPVCRNVRRLPRAGEHPRVLVEGAVSGAGAVADWTFAQRAARTHDVVLAGGLNPDNVGTAIAAVHPFGVDVSSGVEAARGQKDPALIRAFIANARAAYDQLEAEEAQS